MMQKNNTILYILLCYLFFSLLSCTSHQAEIVDEGSTPTSTIDVQATQLAAEVEQQAQTIATLEALVQSQQAEIDALEDKTFVQELLTQGHSVFAINPLLGLRLLLEAWQRMPPGDRASVEASIQLLAQQGRLSVLPPEEIQKLENAQTTPSSPALPPVLTSGNYTLESPGETEHILRQRNGNVVMTLTNMLPFTTTPNLNFHPSNNLGELYYTNGNQNESLTGVKEIVFSPAGEYFALSRGDTDSLSSGQYNVELHRTVDDALLVLQEPGDRQITARFWFSPQGKFLVTSMWESAKSVYRTEDGELLDTFYWGDIIAFSPDDGYYLVYDKRVVRITKLYRGYRPDPSLNMNDGKFSLNDVYLNADFSPDGKFFVVRIFSTNDFELWHYNGNALTRVLNLGQVTGYYFYLDEPHLAVWNNDRQGYLIDLGWLESMQGDTSTDILEIACQPFVRPGLFDETELVPYLGGQEPLACKN